MNLRNILLNSTSFTFEKNIFYQKEPGPRNDFEKNYIHLRQQEHRVYADEVVRYLPNFNEPRSLTKEWIVRKHTMTKLIKYFKEKDGKILMLELGCGNGWLSHQMAISLNAEILGLDINEMELLQGARLFSDCQDLTFIHGDIFTVDISKEVFDIILLASSIQYFPNLNQLIERLFELLKPAGEIHIADSSLHKSITESVDAKKRSLDYFRSLGVPEMADRYFHHTLLDLKKFNHTILYNPNSLSSLFIRKVLRVPKMVFPWILIKRF